MLRPPAAVAPAVQQSIDISHQPGRQQQTRRTLLLQRAMGQTDGRTPYRFIDLSDLMWIVAVMICGQC